MDTTELHRRLENLLTFGTVLAVDAAAGQMRLQIGDNQTDWVPISSPSAGRQHSWRCPSVGEQFLVACPSGELRNATPLIALPSEQNPRPGQSADVSVYQFGAVRVEIDEVSGAVRFQAHTLDLDIASVAISGTVLAERVIKSLQDVVAGVISLKSHKHRAKPPSSPTDMSGAAQ